MFTRKVLRNRVIAVIEKKIESEQRAYDVEEKKLDVKHEEAIKALNTGLVKDKETLLEKHVHAILGKLV